MKMKEVHPDFLYFTAFVFFRWYVLMLLAIFLVLLITATAIACYFDCENRRDRLPGDSKSVRYGTPPIYAPMKWSGKLETSAYPDESGLDVRVFFSWLMSRFSRIYASWRGFEVLHVLGLLTYVHFLSPNHYVIVSQTSNFTDACLI